MGVYIMQKYNLITTMEDKACFIANNMELEYESIDFDGVLLFTVRMDKTIYSVTDYEGYSVFFERFYEADNFFEELIESLIILKDDFDENETLTMSLVENHISFSETIRGDDFDSCRWEELFDDHVFDDDEIIAKAEIAMCDGSVKETFVEMKGGE